MADQNVVRLKELYQKNAPQRKQYASSTPQAVKERSQNMKTAGDTKRGSIPFYYKTDNKVALFNKTDGTKTTLVMVGYGYNI